MMYSFNPVSCSPLGWSDISNTYVEDKDSGSFFILSSTLLTISLPIRDEEMDDGYFCNERLLISLVTEAIDWLSGARGDRRRGKLARTGKISEQPPSTMNFSLSYHVCREALEFMHDDDSGATLAVSPVALTITMPIVDEGNYYFINEKRLLLIAGEAIRTLSGQREEREIARAKAAEAAD